MFIIDSSMLNLERDSAVKGGMAERKNDEDPPSIDISYISDSLHTARNEQGDCRRQRIGLKRELPPQARRRRRCKDPCRCGC